MKKECKRWKYHKCDECRKEKEYAPSAHVYNETMIMRVNWL